MWKGLRVRMGVNYGEAVVHVNPVTGRADYYGTTVNVAARVEGQAEGGTAYITQAVADEVDVAQLNDAVLEYAGARELRGTSKETHLHRLVPSELRLRGKGQEMEESTTTAKSMSLCSVHSVSALAEDIPRFLTVGSGFHRGIGTVGHVRIEGSVMDNADSFPTLDGALCRAVEAADRTQGCIVSVLSLSVMASWNVRQRNARHVQGVVTFASWLKRGLGAKVSVGGATGVVHHGNMGTSHQRFVVVVGQCVDLAQALARGAEVLGADLLVAGTHGQKCAGHDAEPEWGVRKVAEWQTGEDVFEVGLGSSERERKWGWSSHCQHAVAEGNVALLEAKAKEEGDVVLQRAVQYLKKPEAFLALVSSYIGRAPTQALTFTSVRSASPTSIDSAAIT
eukprot:Sspe_Gene.20284::Locus_7437_Transcript_1_1_Confidence_1.000_Length_1423::g.20284::m.20284